MLGKYRCLTLKADSMHSYSRTDMIAVSVALLGVAFLFRDEVADQLDRWTHDVRDRVEERVPLDFEIERARRRTEDLAARIVKQREVVVRQSIDVANLKQEIIDQEQRLAAEKGSLLSRRQSLRASDVVVPIPSIRQEEAAQLETAFENYCMAEATLDARLEVLKIRTESLVNAQKSLRDMESQRHQLQLHVENLGARLELVRTRSETADELPSDTGLDDCRSQLQRLDSRLRFMEGMLDADRSWDPSVVMALDTSEPDIADRIDSYFGIADPVP